MKITALLVKAFTLDPGQGNPAGIVCDAHALTDRQILVATRKLGFAESAFLQASNMADFKLRLFAVNGEVNSCVTATLASAHVIMKEKETVHVAFETRLGIREVFMKDNGLLLMKQPEVKFMSTHTDRTRIAKLLNIPEDNLGTQPIELASAGTPKLVIPIKTLQNLLTINPNLEGIAQYCTEIGGRGFYPFTLETVNPNTDFHARQFNPLDGIPEDPVTGVAAAALMAYFHKHSIITKNRIIGEQGYIVHMPGEIIIEQGGNELYVGGYVIEYGKRILEV